MDLRFGTLFLAPESLKISVRSLPLMLGRDGGQLVASGYFSSTGRGTGSWEVVEKRMELSAGDSLREGRKTDRAAQRSSLSSLNSQHAFQRL